MKKFLPDELKQPFWVAISIIVAVIIGMCSVYVCKMGNDNKIEQAAEEYIEHVSGVKIDLTPGDN